MKTEKRSILLPLFFCLLMLTACSPRAPEPSCPSYHAGSVTLPDMPDFIPRVWPVPDSQLSTACYELSKEKTAPLGRGVGAVLSVDPINLAFSEREDPRYQVVLYIDEGKVVTDTLSVMGMGEVVYFDEKGNTTPTNETGAYRVSWLPELKPGNHQARIEISRDSEETRIYEWSFTITR